MPTTLTPEQETQAQQIVTKLKEQANDHFLAIARTLVATDERTLFGQTEFDIRDQVLKLVGTAYSLHLSQKKTATAAPPSTAPSAAGPLHSTVTARGNRKASEA